MGSREQCQAKGEVPFRGAVQCEFKKGHVGLHTYETVVQSALLPAQPALVGRELREALESILREARRLFAKGTVGEQQITHPLQDALSLFAAPHTLRERLPDKPTLTFGDGDYSCASCGMGMQEPCEHWKRLLASAPTLAATLPVMTERMQGVDCYWCEDGTPHIHAQPAAPVEARARAIEFCEEWFQRKFNTKIEHEYTSLMKKQVEWLTREFQAAEQAGMERVTQLEAALRPFAECELVGNLDTRDCAEMQKSPIWAASEVMKNYFCHGCIARRVLAYSTATEAGK